jgi:hypothetical protein
MELRLTKVSSDKKLDDVLKNQYATEAQYKNKVNEKHLIILLGLVIVFYVYIYQNGICIYLH